MFYAPRSSTGLGNEGRSPKPPYEVGWSPFRRTPRIIIKKYGKGRADSPALLRHLRARREPLAMVVTVWNHITANLPHGRRRSDESDLKVKLVQNAHDGERHPHLASLFEENEGYPPHLR